MEKEMGKKSQPNCDMFKRTVGTQIIGILPVLPLMIGIVAVTACDFWTPDSGEVDADAQWAFHKDESELTSLERHCLRVARAYCDGLTPCCAEINTPIEREICIHQAAETCHLTDFPDEALSQDGREICLTRAEEMFQQCGPQTAPVFMPVDLRFELRCEDQWPSTVEIPAAASEGEACGDVDGLPETRMVPCRDGLHCHRDSGEETLPRFCRPMENEGGPCVYGNECIEGTVCDRYVCQALLPLGAACTSPYLCRSGACCNEVCVEAPAVDAHLCWIYNYPGTGVPGPLQNGTICDSIEYNERGREGEVILQ